MSGDSDLRAAITDPGSQTPAIVAVFEMKGANRVRESLSEDRWLYEKALFYETVLESLQPTDGVRASRLLPHQAWIWHDANVPWAALSNVKRAQEQVVGAWEKLPWSLTAGVALGECVRFAGPGGEPELAGGAFDRAFVLAAQASAGQVLVDAGLAELAETYPSPPDIDRTLSFAAPIRKRTRKGMEPLVYREFLWSGESILTEERSRRRARSGILARWDQDQGRGLVVTDSDDRYYTDRRYLVQGSAPRNGARIFFLDEDPLGPGDANRRAAAGVLLGDRLRGRVVSVEPDVNRAFVEVVDEVGFSQDVITARDIDVSHLREGEIVEFYVDENARGATAAGVVTLADETVSFGSRPTIAARFVPALLSHLRRQGLSGAAAAVAKQASTDWVVPTVSQREQELELMTLAEFAVDHWAVPGLMRLGQTQTAIELMDSAVRNADDAELLQQTFGSIRNRLKTREQGSDGPQHVNVRDVLGVLTEIQLGLRETAKLFDDKAPSGPDRVAWKATDHFAHALSQAFRGKVVTSLPPETAEALGAMHTAGRS